MQRLLFVPALYPRKKRAVSLPEMLLYSKSWSYLHSGSDQCEHLQVRLKRSCLECPVLEWHGFFLRNPALFPVWMHQPDRWQVIENPPCLPNLFLVFLRLFFLLASMFRAF